MRSVRLLVPVALLFALLLGGCATRAVRPTVSAPAPIPTPPPVPISASGVLRLFQWCYEQRDLGKYAELFTDDFRFFFSPLDSAGVAFRSTPWTREDELAYAAALFSDASFISLALDRNFVVFPDPRAGAWDPAGRWRKMIRTQVMLNLRTHDGGIFDISGAATFYLVRGDSAVIPADLKARGFAPDSMRWYIQRWDDETAGPGLSPAAPGMAAKPADAPRMRTLSARRSTWGGVKVYYRLGPVLLSSPRPSHPGIRARPRDRATRGRHSPVDSAS